MPRYLLAFEIEPVRMQEVYYQTPFHCTLMQWFEHPEDTCTILLATAGIIQKRPAIELVSERPALFGPNNDIPVHVLKPDMLVQKLHHDLLDKLEEIGARIENPAWAGTGYRPHVTDTPRKVFTPGSKHLTRHVVLYRETRYKDRRAKVAESKILLR